MYRRELLIDAPSRFVPPADAMNCPALTTARSVAPRRVLVVDDNMTIMQVVAEMIESLGHHVDTAEGGPQALRKFSTGTYDFVLTDLEMPVMNGFNLAARVKKISDHTQTVIMTGCSQAEVLDMMVTAVVDAWLFKPFNLLELDRILRGLKPS